MKETVKTFNIQYVMGEFASNLEIRTWTENQVISILNAVKYWVCRKFLYTDILVKKVTWKLINNKIIDIYADLLSDTHEYQWSENYTIPIKEILSDWISGHKIFGKQTHVVKIIDNTKY